MVIRASVPQRGSGSVRFRGESMASAAQSDERWSRWLQESVDRLSTWRGGELDGGFRSSGGDRYGARGECYGSNGDCGYGGGRYGSGGGYHGYGELGETTALAVLRGKVWRGASGSLIPPAGAVPTNCSTMVLNSCEERNGGGDCSSVQKLHFPTFQGDNPHIWKAKCLEYFRIYNISKCLWVIAATMHMEGDAEHWWQMYKRQHELGSWNQFIHAVEEKFGTAEDRQARVENFSLRQRDMTTLEVVQAQHEQAVFASAASMDVHEPFDGMFHQKSMHQVFDGVPLKEDTAENSEQIVFKARPVPEDNDFEGFDENPLVDVVWDDESLHGLDSHTGLLEQLAQGGQYIVFGGRKLLANPDFNIELTHVSDVQLELAVDSVYEHGNSFEETQAVSDKWVTFEEMFLGKKTTVQTEQLAFITSMSSESQEQIALGDEEAKSIAKPDINYKLSHVNGVHLPLELSMDAAYEVFDGMPLSDVVWDEEFLPEMESHDSLLEQLALGADYLVDEVMKSNAQPNIDDKLHMDAVFDEIPLEAEMAAKSEQMEFQASVVWDSNPQEMLDEISCQELVWDEELLPGLNSSHDDLPQQLALSGEYICGKEKRPIADLVINNVPTHVNSTSLALELGIDTINEVFAVTLCKDVVWGEEMHHNQSVLEKLQASVFRGIPSGLCGGVSTSSKVRQPTLEEVQSWRLGSFTPGVSGLRLGPYMRRQWDPGIQIVRLNEASHDCLLA